MVKPVKACPNRIARVLPLAFDESLSYLEMTCALIEKMNEIIDFANNELSDKLKEYIDVRFSEMMIDTMYDAETETLILYLNDGEN